MKKTIQILGSIFIATALLLSSCTKTDNLTLLNKEESDLGNLNTISEELIFIETPLLTLSDIEDIESQLTDENNEVISDSNQLQLILMPLIENGQMIYDELLSKLQNTDTYFQLSNEDKSIINNLSDFQLAELSFLLSMTINDNVFGEGISQLYSSNTGELILDCLGAATGIADIAAIVQGYRGLNTRDVVRILRKTGTRYLGYVGLALAIIDFVNCMSTAQTNG